MLPPALFLDLLAFCELLNESAAMLQYLDVKGFVG